VLEGARVVARCYARGTALQHCGGGVGRIAIVAARSIVAREGGGGCKSGEGEIGRGGASEGRRGGLKGTMAWPVGPVMAYGR
jgi:hypothetical protein